MTGTMDMERTNGAGGNRVALFIDVDNVLILSQNSGLPFHLPLIIDRVRQQGSIMSSKAYADWTSSLLRPFMGDFRASAIELVQLLTTASAREHKNTADIQLAVDALEMVFSPVRPDTIVIVGGDRDYVPLVQKLKRYGVFVMGIGVEAGVSPVLTEACDSFVYYDNILPPSPEEVAEPISLPDPEEAYSLMVRAIDILSRNGRVPAGATVFAMMKQLTPTFDLARYKTNFKELAQDAQRAGYVALTETPGTDFILALGSALDDRSLPVPEATPREYDFSTIDAITASYRAILQDRRIPLMPWRIRERFVRMIWEGFEERREIGMSMDAMRGILLDYAQDNSLPVSLQMVQKLLYTLNLARCFSTRNYATIGHPIEVPGEVRYPLYPVVDVERAMEEMHRNYLKLLADHGAELHPKAVFGLLYGNEVADDEEHAQRRQALEKLCHDIKPLGPVGQALTEASRRA